MGVADGWGRGLGGRGSLEVSLCAAKWVEGSSHLKVLTQVSTVTDTAVRTAVERRANTLVCRDVALKSTGCNGHCGIPTGHRVVTGQWAADECSEQRGERNA